MSKTETQVVPHLASSNSFLVLEPSWCYVFSLQHCRSISWRHGDKKCRRWKGIRVHLDYRESGVAKKKGRCCIGFHILYYSAQFFFFHTDCELCHAGRGPKRRCAFPHAAVFFLFLTNVIIPVLPMPGGQIVTMLQKSIELKKKARSETAVRTFFLDWACLC